jgi:Zn-dependent protease
MASLVFDVKAKVYKAAKRHGQFSFSEITEFQIGLIAASGIILNFILAIAGYLIGFELFSKLNIYYAFFNMFPISNLDGNKIFFGNLTMWAFLATLTLIGMIATIFVI